MSLFKKVRYRGRSKKIGEFYDKWSRQFLEIMDTFQGFRTEDIDETHAYTVKNAELADEMKILDAGCGVGGPTFYFAQHLRSQLHPITISKVQVEIIQERIKASGLSNIHPVVGDYHDLPKHFEAGSFDRVLFLESLGHSYHPEKVLEGCRTVLKTGGKLYVRDHFIRPELSGDEKTKVAELVAESDNTYLYNHTYLDTLVAQIRKAGFEIDVIQQPDLEFWSINEKIEERFGIKAPDGYFIDTYEIRAVKK